MRLRYLIIVLLSMSLCNFAKAQNQIKIDSLLLEVNNNHSDTTKINALLEISDLYMTDNYLEASKYAQQALDLADTKELTKFQARAKRYMALISYYLGDYKSAAAGFFEALHYSEFSNDTTNLLAISNNLGAVYDRLHQYDNALKYYLQALELLNHSNDDNKEKIQSSLFNNIANIYQTKGDTTSAIQYYKKGLELAKNAGNLKLQGMLNNNLGKLYLTDLKQFDKAYHYLQEGLSARKALGDKAELSKSYNIIGDYYLKHGEPDKAKLSVEEAIRLGSEIGSMEVLINAYSNLSAIEASLRNYKASLEAFTTFKHLSDSIQSQLASSEIARLQLKYDFEKEEQARLRDQKQEHDRYVLIVIILSACLLIAVLIAILIRLKSRQTELMRKSLAQDMDIKNKELTTNVMYLIRKNELINNVAERLLKIQPKVLPENKKVVHSIIMDLQKEADNDTWQEFELRFNQVHTEFYNNLRKLYPDLSPSDEKLCAFLRLNMSSKEIAAITHQSIKSVEVARARLRKKLNLTNTSSNLVTHLSNL